MFTYMLKILKILYNKLHDYKNGVITIRKVDLNMREEEKYLVIKKLVETNGNKKRAALTLGCTVRHVNRMIQGYKKEGKEFFVHGNRGRKPVHALEDSKKQLILDFYRTNMLMQILLTFRSCC